MEISKSSFFDDLEEDTHASNWTFNNENVGTGSLNVNKRNRKNAVIKESETSF